jgi:[acyl-carrier-protein] S-malonyltransferase
MNQLGILCPGQGNQYPAMFEKLRESPAAEIIMRSAAEAFGCHPVDFLQKLTSHELFSNQVAQALIGVLQIATWAELSEMLPMPRLFAGYSVGEFIAYGCVGALSIDETLAMIKKRAAMMDEASPILSGLMAFRGLDRKQIESLCLETGAELAIINSPDHFVIGGSDDAMTRCQTHPLSVRASTVKRLQVTVPSHTSLLSSTHQKFIEVLNISSLKNPDPPVLAGVNGSVVRTREQAIASLGQQLSTTINWLACMQTAIEMGCRVFLELGPGDALAKMLREMAPEIAVRSVDEFRTLQGVASWVKKQCRANA